MITTSKKGPMQRDKNKKKKGRRITKKFNSKRNEIPPQKPQTLSHLTQTHNVLEPSISIQCKSVMHINLFKNLNNYPYFLPQERQKFIFGLEYNTFFSDRWFQIQHSISSNSIIALIKCTPHYSSKRKIERKQQLSVHRPTPQECDTWMFTTFLVNIQLLPCLRPE